MECQVCHRRLAADAAACDFCGGPPGPLSAWRTENRDPLVPPPGAFSSLTPRFRALAGTLLAVVGCAVLSVWDALRRLSDLASPHELVRLEVREDALDGRHADIGVVHMLVVLAVGLAFSAWVQLAWRNAQRAGSSLSGTPLRAAVSIWVPGLNLWKPWQVIDQLWRSSDPALLPRDGHGWEGRRRSLLAPLWWLACLVALVVGNASLLVGVDEPGERLTSRLDIAAAITGAVAALLLLALAGSITRRQAARQAAFRELGPVG